MELSRHIPYSSGLTPHDWQLAEGKFELNTYAKDDILVQQGQLCHRLYFIVQGLVYCQAPTGNICWYEFENQSFTELSSFYSRAPSPNTIRIAEDHSILLSIGYQDLHSLYAASHGWTLWGIRFLQNEILRINEYYESMRYKEATQRYWELVEARPDILQRIPLGHIASYLGISQVSLSRIRAGVQKK